jgi:hypothetical protein
MRAGVRPGLQILPGLPPVDWSVRFRLTSARCPSPQHQLDPDRRWPRLLRSPEQSSPLPRSRPAATLHCSSGEQAGGGVTTSRTDSPSAVVAGRTTESISASRCLAQYLLPIARLLRVAIANIHFTPPRRLAPALRRMRYTHGRLSVWILIAGRWVRRTDTTEGVFGQHMPILLKDVPQIAREFSATKYHLTVGQICDGILAFGSVLQINIVQSLAPNNLPVWNGWADSHWLFMGPGLAPEIAFRFESSPPRPE